jgi:hypothetical protein
MADTRIERRLAAILAADVVRVGPPKNSRSPTKGTLLALFRGLFGPIFSSGVMKLQKLAWEARGQPRQKANASRKPKYPSNPQETRWSSVGVTAAIPGNSRHFPASCCQFSEPSRVYLQSFTTKMPSAARA